MNANDGKQNLMLFLNKYNLLYSKIAPHGNAPNSVPRSQCLKYLLGNSWGAAIIVAPAGFGKSNLVRQYVNAGKENFCWLSLGCDENDIHRFLYYLIAAVKSATASFENTNTLVEILAESFPRFKVAFVNELALLAKPLAIVLDDFHTITHPSIKDFVKYLIANSPENIKIILLSREPISFNIAKYRLDRKIIEIGPDNLRFSRSEIAFMFLKYGSVSLSEAQIKKIETRTEGWPAALQLVYMSAKDDITHEQSLPNFNNQYIKDYIREEILESYSETLRVLLLKSSILSSLTPALCEAVTGIANAGDILENLRQSNTFIISLDKNGKWFRFHHILSDVLYDEFINQYKEDERSAIHKRASIWYENNGYLQEAIDHAISSNDYVFIDEFLDRNVEGRVMLGQLSQLVQWFGKLEEKKISSPIAKIWIVWLKLFSHDVDCRTINYLISSASEIYEIHGRQNDVYALIPAHITAIHGFIATFDEDYCEGIRLSMRALDIMRDAGLTNKSLEGTAIFNLARSWLQLSNFSKAIYYSRQSEELGLAARNYYGAVASINIRAQAMIQLMDLVGAENLYTTTLDFLISKNLADQPFAAYLYCGLAEIKCYRNHLDQATSLLCKSIELSARGREIKSLLRGHRLLAEIYQMQGNRRRLYFHCRKLEEMADRISAKNCLREIRIFKENIRLHEKSLSEVESILPGKNYCSLDNFTDLNEYEAMLHANKLMINKRPADALAIIRHHINLAEQLTRKMSLVRLHFMESRALAQLDRTTDAIKAMIKAMQISLPAEVEVFFAQAKKWMPLKFSANTSSAMALPVLQTMYEDHENNDSCPNPELCKNALTRRELQIMEKIKEGLSNKQIADDMNISEGTVKRHVHNILAKLNVKNRVAAIRL